jgi:hypothetical protein
MKKINLSLNFTHQNFLHEIEKFCSIQNIDYIDGILFFCEKYNIDIDQMSDLIKRDPIFKSKVQFEAEELHYLKRPKRLPI